MLFINGSLTRGIDLGHTRDIHGVAVAPGLAMAPVQVIRAAPKIVPTWSIRGDEVASEVERLDRAIDEVSAGPPGLGKQEKATEKQRAEVDERGVLAYVRGDVGLVVQQSQRL